MDTNFLYPGQIPRTYDLLKQFVRIKIAFGALFQSLVGSNGSFISGLVATAQTVPNLTLNISPGHYFTLAPTNANTYSSIAADSTQIIQEGHLSAAIITSLSTAQLTSGQQQYALIQVGFLEADSIASDDPTGGLIAFFNATSQNQPLQGPSGNGSLLNTVRQGLANISVVYGSPAAAGSAVPPQPSAGCAPMYLVLLSFGQNSITTGEFPSAGPAVYGGYQYAPFLTGLTQSHHSGNAGQSNKIILTNGQEVQGQLPLSLTNASSAGYTATSNYDSGTLPVLRYCIVNPNGNMAGSLRDLALNVDTGALWFCSTAGSISTAVWQAVGSSNSGPVDIYVNTSPYNITNTFSCIQADTTAGNITANMPLVSSVTNGQIEVVLVGQDTGETYTVSIAAAGSDKFIFNGTVSTLLMLIRIGDSRTMKPLTIPSGASAGTYWVVT